MNIFVYSKTSERIISLDVLRARPFCHVLLGKTMIFLHVSSMCIICIVYVCSNSVILNDLRYVSKTISIILSQARVALGVLAVLVET